MTYCATTATNQYVNIVPHEHVHVDLHFPRSEAMPRSANVYAVRTIGGQQAEMLLGPLAQGAHLYFDAKAGGRFVAREPQARTLLLEGSIGYEEDQYFDLSSSKVTFELELDAAAKEAVEVYWVSRDEHAPAGPVPTGGPPIDGPPIGGSPTEAQATDVAQPEKLVEHFHFHAEVRYHTHAHIHAYIYVCGCGCGCACACGCGCGCGCGCVHACTRIHVHMHTYTCTQVSRPGEVLTVSSTAGEEWVVRRKHEPYDKVFGITLVDDPEVHRHVIVVPPRAPPPRSPP